MKKNALFPSRKFLFVDFFWFVLPLQAVLLIQCLFIKGWVEPKKQKLRTDNYSLVVLVRVRDTRLT